MTAAVITASSTSGAACISRLLELHSKRDPSTLESISKLRCIYRSPEKAAKFRAEFEAEQKDKSTIELDVVSGIDADDEPAVTKALQACSVVFIITPHDVTKGMQDDARLTINMINASVAVGVKHIILASSWTVIDKAKDDVSIISSRFIPSEQVLMDLANKQKITYTILRGGFFYSNYIPSFTNYTVPIQFIDYSVPANDPRDIGYTAAHVMVHYKRHANQIYNISGPKMMPFSHVVNTFSMVLEKKTFEFNQTYDVEQCISKSPPFIKQLFRYLQKYGNDAVPMSNDVLKVTGIPPNSLQNWIIDHRHLFE